ncbi:MAG: POTRA domain-containing protein [Vicinamibacterales bacterium]
MLVPCRRMVMTTVLALTLPAVLPAAQAPPGAGRRVTAVTVEIEGRVVQDATLLALIDTRVGGPLSMAEIRDAVSHLDGLGRFEDIQVVTEPAGDGVRVRFQLTPRHPVTAFALRGTLGLPEATVRQAVIERFGATPDAARSAEIVDFLRGWYRDAGHARAVIASALELRHDPDRATVVLTVDAGPAARLHSIRVEGLDPGARTALLDRLAIREGAAHDGRALRAALDKYEQDLRGRGYYEARADLSFDYTPAGDVDLTIVVETGSPISVEFEGDALPQAQRQQLVPVEREASVDEDLLESSAVAIEQYWKARGYRDALVTHRRLERDGRLVIVFTTVRGRRAVFGPISMTGVSGVPDADLRPLLRFRSGEPFQQRPVDASLAAIRTLYTARGFAGVAVSARVEPAPSAGDGDQVIPVIIEVEEGPRTRVTRVVVEGTFVLAEPAVRALLATQPGRPYTDADATVDRERIETEYRNRGYEQVRVRSTVELSADGTEAEVHFIVTEGPQVLVDEVIILGYRRIGRATIERELQFRADEPLGAAALVESQRRLAALGLFRRVTISTRPHLAEARRDVIVEVEEAPPVSLDYGGGVGAERRIRPTALGGQAEERLDVAPRGFVQLTRRNLWGKNRSATIFSRVSSLFRDTLDENGQTVTSRYGLNQYRLVGTFREPRVFGTAADLLAVATMDQSVRSSFNFRTRELVGRAALRPSARYGLTGTYTYRSVHLFGETFSQEERPIIDRLFPQVALSMFGVAMLRDTRTDPLDPDGGTFVATDQTFAARAYGSQVGFVKSTFEGKAFLRLPSARRIVLAVSGRLGAAHGFEQTVNGQIVRDQLPASERFFAGGDTTVRGFSLDRLGDAGTITSGGFPTGGNGLIVLNAELRTSVTAALQGVVFLDAGNVYPLASDITLRGLRPAAGFGVRYRSPIGPVRVDWGINLDRRELIPGTRERRNVFHVSLGQAF